MTDTNDLEHRISRWMEGEEAGTRYPDRLLQAAFEESRTLRQVRSLPRWMPRTNRPLMLLAATAGAVLALIALGILGLGALRDQLVTPPSPPLRLGEESLVFDTFDIAAQDPATGEVRTIVETDDILECTVAGCRENFIKGAQWSPDGRWVAFDVSYGSLDLMPRGPCGPSAGLWVHGTSGEPRQLTTPCATTPGAESIDELWAWSPDGAWLAYVRTDADDQMLLIDPATGEQTILVETAGQPSMLAWSPDATRLVYVAQGTIVEVRVPSGERTVLASGFDGMRSLAYAPDGSRILASDYVFDDARARLQVMNADGSDLHTAGEGKETFDEAAWSADGQRILYQLSITNEGSDRWDSEVWTVAPDGANPVKVFDSDGCDMGPTGDALPVWAPDGTVAYNACRQWVASNADGTGEPRPIDERLHRSWAGGGLHGWDLLGL